MKLEDDCLVEEVNENDVLRKVATVEGEIEYDAPNANINDFNAVFSEESFPEIAREGRARRAHFEKQMRAAREHVWVVLPQMIAEGEADRGAHVHEVDTQEAFSVAEQLKIPVDTWSEWCMAVVASGLGECARAAALAAQDEADVDWRDHRRPGE